MIEKVDYESLSIDDKGDYRSLLSEFDTVNTQKGHSFEVHRFTKSPWTMFVKCESCNTLLCYSRYDYYYEINPINYLSSHFWIEDLLTCKEEVIRNIVIK